MKIIHISDTHGDKFHSQLLIPECDVLIHSGDIGGRTTPLELEEFLRWFNKQPAKKKVWVAGNHDLCMDRVWAEKGRLTEPINYQIKQQIYRDALRLLKEYPEIVYLEDQIFGYEGLTFYGSPMTPSFHRQHWAFNLDRGEEIRANWEKIPEYIDVLITHGPPYGILDRIPDEFRNSGEEAARGCVDLLERIKKLPRLRLHCFGHIHSNTGVTTTPITPTRDILMSNGSVLDNRYRLVLSKPQIIEI